MGLGLPNVESKSNDLNAHAGGIQLSSAKSGCTNLTPDRINHSVRLVWVRDGQSLGIEMCALCVSFVDLCGTFSVGGNFHGL